MPKFSKEEKEKKYLKLIEEGEILFNKRGFYDVTAEDIALSAGIAKGTFYHFFDNKEHLYMVINNKLQKKIFENMEIMINTPSTSSQSEKLYQLICYVLDAFIEHPLIMEFDFNAWERIREKAPKECIEENEENDIKVFQLLEKSGVSFRYDLETTMQIIQKQFVQYAAIKQEKDSLKHMKIVLKALSEHLVFNPEK